MDQTAQGRDHMQKKHLPTPTPKTVPQPTGTSTDGPHVGQPFNFGHLSDWVQVPLCVLAWPGMPPGAALLWGVIMRLSRKHGVCRAKTGDLAAMLQVTERQVQRYDVALRIAGFSSTLIRDGFAPERRLLWHPSFNAPENEEGGDI